MRARRPTYVALSLACVASLALGSACDDHVRAQPDLPAELTVDADAEPELSPELGPPPAIGPVLTLDDEAAELEAALNSTCEPLLQLADSPWAPCRSPDGWALPLAPVSIWARSSNELWVGGNGTMLREGEGFRCVGQEKIGALTGSETEV